MGLLDQNNLNPRTAIQQRNPNALITSVSAQLQRSLPARLRKDADRFERLLATDFRKNPKLFKCDEASLLAALMEVAQLGLEPGAAQQIHLVPYGRECKLIIGFRGYVEIARNAGVTIHVPVPVYEGDDWREQPSSPDQPIIHNRKRRSAELTYVWCRATDGDGDKWKWLDVMTRDEIDQIGASQLTSNRQNPWQTNYVEMAKKTVVRRLSKMLPASAKLQHAAAIDETVYGNADAPVIDLLPEPITVEEVDPDTGEVIPPAVGA